MHIVLPNAFDLAPTLQHGQNRKRNPRITSPDHVWSLIYAKILSERVVDLPVQFSQMGQRLSEPVITQLMTSALADPEMLSLAAGFTITLGCLRLLSGKLLPDLQAIHLIRRRFNTERIKVATAFAKQSVAW